MVKGLSGTSTRINRLYREIPLYQALEEAADEFPGRRALSFLGKRMTFQEVRQEARSFAQVLQDAGLEKGDRVGLMFTELSPVHDQLLCSIVRRWNCRPS